MKCIYATNSAWKPVWSPWYFAFFPPVSMYTHVTDYVPHVNLALKRKAGQVPCFPWDRGGTGCRSNFPKKHKLSAFPHFTAGGNTTQVWPSHAFFLYDPFSQRRAQQMPRWFAIMTPVHHTRIFRCCHTTGMTVVPWDGVTSSSSAGKAGGLLCFLQLLRFWDGPCFSTSRGLAAPLLGTRTSSAKVKVAECTMHVGQGEKNLL